MSRYLNEWETAVLRDRELSNMEKTHKEKLAAAAWELMELRWHWTLDETNPERANTFTEWAAAVGKAKQLIRRYANGWALFLASDHRDGQGSPNDWVKLADYGEDGRIAIQAVAEKSGQTITRAHSVHQPTIQDVRDQIRGLPADQKTAVAKEALEDVILEKGGRVRPRTQPEPRTKFIDTETGVWIQVTQHLQRGFADHRKALRTLTETKAAIPDDVRELITDEANDCIELLNKIIQVVGIETEPVTDEELDALLGRN